MDTFKVVFADDCSLKERKFFAAKYPCVDDVANERVHCTSCDVHIGTAPLSADRFRTHPVLGVMQCNDCHANKYQKDPLSLPGPDGSEFFCKWCGDGGDLLCCSKCTAVFCEDCVKLNFSVAVLKKIEEDDDWLCFLCNTEPLKHHRARHWALRNFIKKQETQLHSKQLPTYELCKMLSVDRSKCCQKPTLLKASLKRSLSHSPVCKVSVEPTRRSHRSMSALHPKPSKSRPSTSVPTRSRASTPVSVKAIIRTEDVPPVPSSILCKKRPPPATTFLRRTIDECKEITGVMKICQNTISDMETLLNPVKSPQLNQMCATLHYLQTYSAGLVKKHQENIEKECEARM